MKAEVTEIKSLSGGRGSGQKVRQKNPACVFWQRKRTNSSKTPNFRANLDYLEVNYDEI